MRGDVIKRCGSSSTCPGTYGSFRHARVHSATWLRNALKSRRALEWTRGQSNVRTDTYMQDAAKLRRLQLSSVECSVAQFFVRWLPVCQAVLRSILGSALMDCHKQMPEWWNTRKTVILYIFWCDRVCWPLLCLCRPFCIFERCLGSNLTPIWHRHSGIMVNPIRLVTDKPATPQLCCCYWQHCWYWPYQKLKLYGGL